MADISVRAEMTGIVSKVITVAGQQVTAGDTVIIMESMKMEIPVESPVTGQIAIIHVDEGQQISEGDVVAIIAGL